MKEKYIEEIIQYVNAQDESQVKGLAELTRIVDKSRLIYIIALVSKLFGGGR